MSEESKLRPENKRMLKRLKELFNNDEEEAGPSKRPKKQSKNPGPSTSKELSKLSEELTSKKLVFQDKNIAFFVQKYNPKKHDRFSTTDHIFQLSVKSNDNSEDPLLASLMDGLDKSLNNILNDLKKLYDLKLHHMVFITILDKNIVGSIRSGGFDLNTPNSVIINTILGYFESFLQSKKHLDLRLNNEFSIHFRVVSPKHVEQWKKKKEGKVHTYGSKLFTIKTRIYPFLVNSPKGFAGNEKVFENECLIISCIVAHANNKLMDNKMNKEETDRLKYQLNPETEIGGSQVLLELKKIKEICNLTNGPYNAKEVLPLLEKYFKSHICILEYKECLKITEQSSPIEVGKPVLFLYAETNDQTGHTFAILNLQKFCNKFNSFVCLYCHKTFKTSHGRHKCSSCKTFCYCCWRPQEEIQFGGKLYEPFICMSSNNKSESRCISCNRLPNSKDCFEYHKRTCRKAFFCSNCNRLLQLNGLDKNFDNLKKNHNCKSRKCKVCYEESTDLASHICKLKVEKWQRHWPKLCIANICLDGSIKIYREKEYHEVFHFDSFNESTQNHNWNEEDMTLTYFPKIITDKKTQTVSGITPFGQEAVRDSFENCFGKTKSPLEMFLFQVLTQKDYKNTVIILKSQEIHNLDIIIRMITDLGMTPTVRRKDSKVILIKFEDQNVKFLDPDSYFTASTKNIEHFRTNVINYLIEMFQLQSRISDIYRKKIPNGYKTFLHPFGTGFCTAASFSHGVFKMFCLKEDDIYVMKKDQTGIHSVSSKPEIKYLQYLQYLHPDEQFESGLSPFGAKYFKSSIPDAFIAKSLKAFYFHGCQIHGCPKKKCPIRKGRTKNFLNIPDEIVWQEDARKMSNLAKECPGIDINVIWECEFQDLVKNDPSFQDYYKERTRKRLCPKNA